MKNLFNLIFSPKVPINGVTYFIINLILLFLSIIIIIILVKILGLSIIDTLINYSDHIKDYLLVITISETIFLIPSILFYYKRINDTNLSFYWFHTLIAMELIIYIYILISYFFIFIYNENFISIISLVSMIATFGLAFIPSKNKIINENKEEEEIIDDGKIKFFPVKPLKFVLMSIFTFGIYDIYWFYKNFKYIKENYPDSTKIWPFIRAIFSPITSYFFLRKLFYKNINLAVGVAILYFLFAGGTRSDNVIYGIIGILSPLILLPAVYEINKLNNSKENENLKSDKKYNFNLVNYIFLGIMSPVIIFFIAISLYIIPSGSNIKGGELWFWQKNYIQEEKYIDKSEEIKYFYTDGFATIKSNGIIITDKSIGIYSNPEGEEKIFNKMYYKDIKNMEEEKDEDSYFTKVIKFYPKNKEEGILYIVLDSGEKYSDIVKYLNNKIEE